MYIVAFYYRKLAGLVYLINQLRSRPIIYRYGLAGAVARDSLCFSIIHVDMHVRRSIKLYFIDTSIL
jgi:hypothetical protein